MTKSLIYTHNIGPAQTAVLEDNGFICHTVTDLDRLQLKDHGLVDDYLGCLINMSIWVIIVPVILPMSLSFDTNTNLVIDSAIDHGQIRTSIIGLTPGKDYHYKRDECQEIYISWETFWFQNFFNRI